MIFFSITKGMTFLGELEVSNDLDSPMYLDLGEGPPIYAEVARDDLARILEHLNMKAEPSKNVQQFKLGEGFQAEYDAWKAKVEQEGRGVLDVTHQEVVKGGAYVILTWRVVPRLHVSRRR